MFQQKLAKREVGAIDRSQDVARLQEFYMRYREKNRVDELHEEERRLRESAIYSGNLGEYDFFLFLSFKKFGVGFPSWFDLHTFLTYYF
jgi:hypothetical protein